MRARTPATTKTRSFARVLAVGFLMSLLGSFGCGGSAGVDNGSIAGRVFANVSGGSSTPTPLAGVTIVAQRNGTEPAVIRTTVANENGEFIFTNMPTGEYSIGYSIRGFEVIDTAQGATNSRTAVGNGQVRVFVEPESTSLAPDITLNQLAAEGDATVILTLSDIITGDPVTNATVTVGSATTSNGGANGVYTLSVPIRVASGGDGANGTAPMPLPIIITADGYNGSDLTPSTVTPVANETVSITVQVTPFVSRITGFVQISQFQTLYNRMGIAVTVDNVPIIFSSGTVGTPLVVDTNGFFTVSVPASNSVLTRQFNLNFTAPNLQTAVVSNIVAPSPGGTRQLTSPVVMQPVTIDLVGTVVDSNGNAPNQLNPQGIPDTVIVAETGQVGNVINGSYTIPDVPATDPGTVGPATLMIIASVFNPTAPNPGGGFGVQEQAGPQTISPVSDGTANPTFTVQVLQAGGT